LNIILTKNSDTSDSVEYLIDCFDADTLADYFTLSTSDQKLAQVTFNGLVECLKSTQTPYQVVNNSDLEIGGK
jgi:hypothetical protein